MKYTLKLKQFPPKTPKQVKQERRQIITEYLDGNLQRFLRRNYEFYRYQLVFSKDLKKWSKDDRVKIVEYLKKEYIWPTHICEVVNTMKTLVKYYNRSFSLGTMHLAIAIIDLLDNDIWVYGRKRWNKRFKQGLSFVNFCTAEEAFKEQKARGFIHVNKFEDYEKTCSHVYSNVNVDYIYPINFPHMYSQYNSDIPSDYIALSIIGVQGFTRIEVPKLFK